MKVYVLETGCYEGRGIHGVYATPEAAMAAWQPKPSRSHVVLTPPSVVYDMTTHKTTTVVPALMRQHSYMWADSGEGWWTFDADWDHAADITEYEVQQ